MHPRKRRLFQNFSEATIFLAVVGLCSLALSGEKRPSWIRRPSLSENLAETPRLFQCMSERLKKTGVASPRLHFSGPILTKARDVAWYFVYLDKGDALYRLEFLASTGQKWRLFSYGGDFQSRIGAFTGRMEITGALVDRSTDKKVAEVDLFPCADLLGQGVGHGR